jgi:hypothetical protein
VVVQRLDDRTGQDDAQPGADAEDRRDHRDAVRDTRARELVADDPERQREDGAAAALDHAGRDEHLDVGRQRGEQGAGAEDGQREHQRALLAEHVAQAPDDRREDRRAQQVGGQDPGHRGLRGVQFALDLGQRRCDQRLQDGERARGQRQDGERQAVVLAVGSVGGGTVIK